MLKSLVLEFEGVNLNMRFKCNECFLCRRVTNLRQIYVLFIDRYLIVI